MRIFANMRIIAILLALILTLLPDGFPVTVEAYGQNVCVENVVDMEEEAVIRSCERARKQYEGRPVTIRKATSHPLVQVLPVHTFLFCFENTFLTACCLRL